MIRSRNSRTNLKLQRLEARETPATLVSPTTVTYQDVDGDVVTIRISKPLFIDAATADSVLDFSASSVDGNNNTGQQLEGVNLFPLGSAAQGIGVSITALRSATTGGDGLVNVGHIDAVDASASLEETHCHAGRYDRCVLRLDVADCSAPAKTIMLVASLDLRSFGCGLTPGGRLAHTTSEFTCIILRSQWPSQSPG
jgi:hypothetical protein